ncbi:MAG: HYR domain-containing protein [Saprospiraceae bacterium]|nr:HYR domain-containing protein [Saprospiraceae bacterium]MDW8230689.1 HYR domain-containing protein [Saprospiraceae bacterium]
MRHFLLLATLFAISLTPTVLPGQSIRLTADSITVPCHNTDTFLMPIRLFNFKNIAGLQFTFSWTPAHLKYIHIRNINSEFSGAGLDTITFRPQGRITFSWTTIGSKSLPDSTILFSVAFVRLGGPLTTTPFIKTPTDIVAFNAQFDEVPVTTTPGKVRPLDNQPPLIICPASVTLNGFGPTPVNNIGIDSLFDNCSLESIGWSTTGATVGNYPNDPDASGEVFNIGQSIVTYTVKDAGGNTASCTFSITINLNPGDSLTLVASNHTTNCGQTVTVNISVLNFDSITGLQFSLGWNTGILKLDTIVNAHPSMALNPSNFGFAQANNGFLGFAWTSPLPSGLTLPDGTILFSLKFTVVAPTNGVSPITFGDTPTAQTAFAGFPPEETGFLTIAGSVTLNDNIPPTLVCPANVSITTPPGVITHTFNNLAPANLTDNCTAPVQLTYARTGTTPGSGSGPANGTYNAGTTVVTYTATDGAGNTSTCSFTVLVDAGTPLTLILDTVSIDCQDSAAHFAINVRVRDFVNITGLQFDITWDSARIKFDSVGNLRPGFNLTATNFFGFTSAINGNTLKFFAGNASGYPSIPNNEVLFTIYFKVKTLGSSPLNFTGTINAVNTSFNLIPVTLVPGLFKIADLSPPVLTCPSQLTFAPDSGLCTKTFVLNPPGASDACSGIKSVVSNKQGNTYLPGPNLVVFTATDNAGNTATCSITVIIAGSTAPKLSNCPVNLTVSTSVNATNCTAKAFWSLPQAINPCDGTSVPVTASDTSGTAFPVGVHKVTFKAGTAPDTSECSFTVTVLDATPPTVTCPPNLTLQITPDSTGQTGCSAEANFNLPKVQDLCDSAPTFLISPALGSTVFAGVTTVTVTAVDNAGNSASCQFLITVVDAAPPAVSGCPKDTLKVLTAQDSCGATVSWGKVSFTDDCSATVAVDPPNYTFDFFPVGTHPVNIIGTDAGGNVAVCSFVVVVRDATPPVISNCPQNLSFVLPPDSCSKTVFWTIPSVTDNCGQPTLNGPQSPGLFLTGKHTIVYVATDASGNTASCVFSITVLDIVPPKFSSCPSNITVQNASPCGNVVPWKFPAAADNCQLDTIIATKLPTDTIFSQVTNVVIRAVDASGNADTCSFTITLDVLIVPPAFANFPPDITVYGCAQPVSWTPPVSNGKACDPDTIVFAPYLLPGDTFPRGTTLITYYLINKVKGDTLAQKALSITVRDTVAPAFANCPTAPIVVHIGGQVLSGNSGNIITQADTTGNCQGVRLQFIQPNASDNCGAPVITQTQGIAPGNVFSAGTTTQVFTATDDSGNSALCSFNIVVVGLEPLVATVDPPIACPGEDVTLMAPLLPNATYVWKNPAGQTLPNTGPTLVIDSIRIQQAGAYTVSAVINGCASAPASIEVKMAEVKANPDTIRIQVGVTVDTFSVVLNDFIFPDSAFTVEPVGSLPEGLTHLGKGVFRYQVPSNFRPVSFLYKLCSSLCPKLCDEIQPIIIRLEERDCGVIPNIFSPNGDGVNDTFRIPCLASGAYPNNTVIIYNQWGDKVFEASPYDNNWKGTLNGQDGKDLPDGVYYYIFRPSPDEMVRKGFIQIHR